jgi:hypothetical protein
VPHEVWQVREVVVGKKWGLVLLVGYILIVRNIPKSGTRKPCVGKWLEREGMLEKERGRWLCRLSCCGETCYVWQ